jgi:hydrogenase maturation protease
MIYVIGIGNRFRGDDGAGLAVARALRDMALPDVTVVEQDGDAVSLLEILQTGEPLFIVDAVCSGAATGTLFRLDVTDSPIPVSLRSGGSTHALGVAEALGLSRALGYPPARRVIYGIEGEDFSYTDSLSAAVRCAVEKAAAAIREELIQITS